MPNNNDRRASLESVINTAISTQLKDVHTMLPGQIINFDPTTQLADIQPQLQRKIGDKLINLPVLSQVPIRFFNSKNFSISFPLQKDDEVAIYFIERSIDNWLEDGGIQSPNDTRRFDLSDAYAVPVLYSQQEKIEDFDPDNMVIKSNNGNAKITLKTDGTILMETTGNTEITSAKTKINNDLEVDGTLKVTGNIIGEANAIISGLLSASGYSGLSGSAMTTNVNIESAADIKASGISLKSHTHPYTWTDPAGSGNTLIPT